MTTEIAASEARTKFSELLRRVKQGERFIVTVRGEAIADLTPAQRSIPQLGHHSEEEREAAFQRLRNPKISGVPGDTILEWIREGRH